MRWRKSSLTHTILDEGNEVFAPEVEGKSNGRLVELVGSVVACKGAGLSTVVISTIETSTVGILMVSTVDDMLVVSKGWSTSTGWSLISSVQSACKYKKKWLQFVVKYSLYIQESKDVQLVYNSH